MLDGLVKKGGSQVGQYVVIEKLTCAGVLQYVFSTQIQVSFKNNLSLNQISLVKSSKCLVMHQK